jgi:hypothetical protein
MTDVDLALFWLGLCLAFVSAVADQLKDWGLVVPLNPLQKYRARAAFMDGLRSASAKAPASIDTRQRYFYQAGRTAAAAPNPQNLPADSLFRHALVDFEGTAAEQEVHDLIALSAMTDSAPAFEPIESEPEENESDQGGDDEDQDEVSDDDADHDAADDDDADDDGGE